MQEEFDDGEEQQPQAQTVDPIAHLTARAFALREAGEIDRSDAMFSARSRLAEGADVDEVMGALAATEAASETGKVRDGLSSLPGGPELAARYGTRLGDVVRYGDYAVRELVARDPKIEPVLEALVQSDARWLEVAADIGRSLVARGLADALPAYGSSPQPQWRKSDMDNAETWKPTAAPSSEKRESIEAEIDGIMAQFPPGSAGYSSPKLQKKLQSLYAALGDQPLVGNIGRTI